jgi:hypothetical protein
MACSTEITIHVMKSLIENPVATANILVKAALILLLIYAVANQDLPQFNGKAMTGRALTYPIAILIVPAVWWIMKWMGHKTTYPHLVDLLVALPFLIDTAGNALNLYDTINWWDDFNHFLNWAILTGAFAALLVRTSLNRWAITGLIVGFGSVMGVLWELAEYFTFVRDSPELATAYTDTLGDLTLDLIGALLTAAICWRFLGRQRPNAMAGT